MSAKYEASYCGASDDGHVECEMPYLKDRIAAIEKLCRQQNEALERSLLAIDAFWPNDRPENEGQASEDRVINEVRKMLRASIAAYAALFPKAGGAK